jgi:hypothetical protein
VRSDFASGIAKYKDIDGKAARLLPDVVYSLLLEAADVAASASFSASAHSWQQTSTVLPPSLTVMVSAPSTQSQAAHVVFFI